MKKLLLILLCLPMVGFGQGWKKTFGLITKQEYGNSVQQTTDGGYIISGYGLNLIKTNGNGDSLWTKNYMFDAESVQQTSDGGYITTGIISTSFPGGDIYLLKTDGNGNEQWSKSFGGTDNDWGYSVQQTTDGGYIISGAAELGFGGKTFLIKTDVNGDSLWTKKFDCGGPAGGHSVQQTTDGGYIITDYTSLLKTDGNGTLEWCQDFSNSGIWNIQLKSVQQTTDGGYITAGNIFNLISAGAYLVKTDSNGIEQWSKIFGSGNDIAYSVQQTTDGGFIFVGRKINNGSYVYLVKTDGNGIEQWNQTFGKASGRSIGFSVQQTNDGGYIITGVEDTINNTNQTFDDIILIKTDGNGNATSTFNIPINPNRKLDKSVDILGRETKGKKNEPLLYLYDDGSVEKRIVIE